MDYLQYFKYYNFDKYWTIQIVLNLIINGLPSILKKLFISLFIKTFTVLNLIINGLPSILDCVKVARLKKSVLNLIINGLPSILPFNICPSPVAVEF